MKYIEMKSEGYTYRYDFNAVPSTDETFNPNNVIYKEAPSNAEETLDVCLQLLRAVFGTDKVKEALGKLDKVDF